MMLPVETLPWRPLDRGVQTWMSRWLGHDFSGVRVHTGPQAQGITELFGARALTVGSDIFFAGGAYEPDSARGWELLAHELVHVVQQEGARGGVKAAGATVAMTDGVLEEEAEFLSRLAVTGGLRRRGAARGVRFRTPVSGVVQAKLRDTCMTAPPRIISCHATTMWWMYKEKNGAGASWDAFLRGDHDVAEYVAKLIREYGKERTKWFTIGGISVNQGAVLVFSEGTLRTDLVSGHSCVCGNDGRLHGSSQGGCFDCPHGKSGMCDHAPNEINWTKMSQVNNKYKVYSVEEDQAMKWAAANL